MHAIKLSPMSRSLWFPGSFLTVALLIFLFDYSRAAEYEDDEFNSEEEDLRYFDTFHDIKGIHPPFKRGPELHDLDCSRIVGNDQEYIRLKAKKRISYVDQPALETDCESIKARNYFPTEATSEEERDFGIAFSKTVFKDYLFVESELAASYAPQNWYCFAIDAKSNKLFKQRVNNLASCFPNVFVLDKELSMDSGGHNQSTAHYECMKILATRDRQWKYLITAQNHDMQIKTNQELVQIFKWMQGANDVEICYLPKGRVNFTLGWTFQELQLFRNHSLNLQRDRKGHPERIRFAKGYLESSLSREFVDFIVRDLDLTRFIGQLDQKEKRYIDEIFLQSLVSTDALRPPGGFTHRCLDKGIHTPYVTRFNIWFANNTRCGSKHSRHSLCIFGIEDIALNFVSSYSLLANKMSPKFDYGAVGCWHEEMHNRTYFRRNIDHLRPRVYRSLPQVRYHVEKMRRGEVSMRQFDCRYPYAEEFAFLDIKLFNPTPMESNPLGMR
ncbi:core-2/I-Branching enzyme domain-containing protein [Ditylenchus destructor]|uniref:Core-2/I-Branching enzyme domain-containing protein n=1 Tax=Ditylenchus destructor TaxID=166010 RepID=A0AAD4NES4_9BILA|nr:core-2/I-Branching enzyme domain-containing protein [Ditylenchus destructor]